MSEANERKGEQAKKRIAEPERGGIPKAEAVVYLDPRGGVVKLQGLGAELQGLNPANAYEALQYAEELLWNALHRVRASLALWSQSVEAVDDHDEL